MKRCAAWLLAIIFALGITGCSREGKSPDGMLGKNEYTAVVAYAGWADPDTFCLGGLNAQKMYISSVQHLPIYRFDTMAQFTQFRSSCDPAAIAQGYDEMPSLQAAAASFDEAFFEENTLLMVYVGSSSGTYRFGVNSVFCDGKALCIHVEQTNHPQVATDDMAGWLILVVVPNHVVKDCVEFDADLNHFN